MALETKVATLGEEGVDRPAVALCEVLGRPLSVLARGEAPVLTEDIAELLIGDADLLTVSEDVVPLRPKNDSRPPLDFFFPSSEAGEPSLLDSRIFHPAGVMSS